MKIKTIYGTDVSKVDDEVNSFESSHKVKFTQTRTAVNGSGIIIHFYTIFYEED